MAPSSRCRWEGCKSTKTLGPKYYASIGRVGASQGVIPPTLQREATVCALSIFTLFEAPHARPLPLSRNRRSS